MAKKLSLNQARCRHFLSTHPTTSSPSAKFYLEFFMPFWPLQFIYIWLYLKQQIQQGSFSQYFLEFARTQPLIKTLAQSLDYLLNKHPFLNSVEASGQNSKSQSLVPVRQFRLWVLKIYALR